MPRQPLPSHKDPQQPQIQRKPTQEIPQPAPQRSPVADPSSILPHPPAAASGVSPARERCETTVLSADSHRFCACAHSLLLPTPASSRQSAEVNSCCCQHRVRWGLLLVGDSFRRTGTDRAGRLVCRLGPVLCPSGMRISGSSEEKRNPAAGSGAGGSGEPQAVWSPAQRVSTRRSLLVRRWFLLQRLARCVTLSGTLILALKANPRQIAPVGMVKELRGLDGRYSGFHFQTVCSTLTRQMAFVIFHSSLILATIQTSCHLKTIVSRAVESGITANCWVHAIA